MTTKIEPGKWYNENWLGPDILIEFWDGQLQRLPLKEAVLDEYSERGGIKRWCLFPDYPEPESGSCCGGNCKCKPQ